MKRVYLIYVIEIVVGIVCLMSGAYILQNLGAFSLACAITCMLIRKANKADERKVIGAS